MLILVVVTLSSFVSCPLCFSIMWQKILKIKIKCLDCYGHVHGLTDWLWVPLSLHLGLHPWDIGQSTLQLMGLHSGRYMYYDDLLGLSTSPTLVAPSSIISNQPGPSPVDLSRLAQYLISYPDQRLAIGVPGIIRYAPRLVITLHVG